MENFFKITNPTELNKIFDHGQDKLVILMFYTKNNVECRRALQIFEKMAVKHNISIFCVIDTDKFEGESRYLNNLGNMPKFECYFMGNSLGSNVTSNEKDIEGIIHMGQQYVMRHFNGRNNNQTQLGTNQMGMNQMGMNQMDMNQLGSMGGMNQMGMMGLGQTQQLNALQIQQQILNNAQMQNPLAFQYLMQNSNVLQQMVQKQMMQQQQHMMHPQQQMMQQQQHMMHPQQQIPQQQIAMNPMINQQQLMTPQSMQMNPILTNSIQTPQPLIQNSQSQMLTNDSNISDLPTFQQMERMFKLFQMMHKMGALNIPESIETTVGENKTNLLDKVENNDTIIFPNGDKLIPLPNGKFGLIKNK